MTRLLVTGASGLLGINLAYQASQKGHQVTGTTHEHSLKSVPFATLQVDLTREGEIEQIIERCHPEAVIHCAAVANLESAEANPEHAQQLNAELPGRLAAIAHRRQVQFIHLSTDAVFDGVKGNYSEDDLPNPQSIYARTKLAGEQAVAKACPDALIARVNFYGWSLSGKRSLAEFFFYNLSGGKSIMGFTDVYFCPLEVTTLADLLLQCIERKIGGLYHIASRECLSKYAFGVALARKFGLDETLIKPVSVMESNLVAHRSPNLSLCVEKIAQALNISLPDQAEGLQKFCDTYQAGYPQKYQSLN